MANDAQHRAWRDDARDNLESARNRAGDDPELRLMLDLAAAEVAITASLAERVSELTDMVRDSTGALIEVQQRAIAQALPHMTWWKRWRLRWRGRKRALA